MIKLVFHDVSEPFAFYKHTSFLLGLKYSYGFLVDVLDLRLHSQV